MYCNAREVTFAQQLVELIRTKSALDEDNHLVKLEAVQQLVQLPVLLRLTEFDVVLLETVQSKLCIVIDVDFQRIPHEFLANGSDLLRESGAEHHHLLVGGSSAEDLLDIAPHVLDSWVSTYIYIEHRIHQDLPI